MSEFAMPTFADNDDSWKYRDGHGAHIEGSNSKRDLDRRLDQALEETFPASDAVSILISVNSG
jgi:hypothetical protein